MTSDSRDYTNAHYESQGLVRYMIITTPEHRARINQLAKQYKCRQGDVVEALLDSMSEERLARAMGDRAKAPTPTVLAKQIKQATPEQLKAIQAIMEGAAE